jgi:hypothetical protein
LNGSERLALIYGLFPSRRLKNGPALSKDMKNTGQMPEVTAKTLCKEEMGQKIA